MTWNEHIHQMSSKISKRCGVIRHFFPKDTLVMLANSIVLLSFNYCSCVWSNTSAELLNSLQVLQNRLARIILSADVRTPVNDMMHSLQRNKLNDRWYNYMITMILNCMKGKAPEYISSQFVFMSDIDSKGTRSQSNNCLYEPKWNIGAGNRTFHSRAVKL